MVRKYWPVFGLSDEKYEKWRIESIIMQFFDIKNDFEGADIEDSIIYQIISETQSNFEIGEIENIINLFKEWQRTTFQDIIEQYSGKETSVIADYIVNNPQLFHEFPSGEVNNMINHDFNSICEYIDNYFESD